MFLKTSVSIYKFTWSCNPFKIKAQVFTIMTIWKLTSSDYVPHSSWENECFWNTYHHVRVLFYMHKQTEMSCVITCPWILFLWIMAQLMLRQTDKN